jgi:hypothetical protein
MRLLVEFTGLFLFVVRDNAQLHVLAPTTPPEHPHTITLEVIDGKATLSDPDLNCSHFVIAGGGNQSVSPPDKLPNLSERSGGRLKDNLLGGNPPDPSLHCRITVRGVESITSHGGAFFEIPDNLDRFHRVIANAVYCDLGTISAPLKIEPTCLDGTSLDPFTVDNDPETEEDRIYLRISHAPRGGDSNSNCFKHRAGTKPSHYLSLYSFFTDCKMTPQPIFRQCVSPVPSGPWKLPKKRGNISILSVDPVTCVGGGG